MRFLEVLNAKKENDLHFVCKNLLEIYQVKYTKLNLIYLLDNHIDNPSLLTIKDTLFEYGIESAAINKGKFSYVDFETPFVCSIQKKNWQKASFTLVSNVTDKDITYLDPEKHKYDTISFLEFENIDKGVVLLTDDNHKKDEANLKSNLVKQRNINIAKNMPIYMFCALLIFTLVNIIFNYQLNISWINVVFTSTSFVGLLISNLLLLYHIETNNPVIREVCGGNTKKLNCDSILNSSHSSFFGISWSIWGFSYMATLFTLQIFFTTHIIYTYIIIISAIIISPYIIFSFYYQAKIVKQWCPLCLIIQFALIINFISSLVFIKVNGFIFSISHLYNYLLSLSLFLFIVLAVYSLLPIIKNSRKYKNMNKNWRKLRYNSEIFQTLLYKNDKIKYPTDNLGIVIGNPNAKNEIVKVCNPFCEPCSKAHPELEEIIKRNNDVKVRIIFTASGEQSDSQTAPVTHLLAIQEKYGQNKIMQALDDWYSSHLKIYTNFAEKYPIDFELENQKAKINAMWEWCDNMKIRATPTIYINGFEYPDSYKISELKNFF
ncbi:vitamin K epoxide reductase family protein [Sphingobacterium sp. HJSM2_6]|uniref:vitamin K epoxide reductase family protein n=1 Tax=Sphingobacterium sp. HJSM2_6 TaxID=3366264 RepID=UPI003BE5CCB5